MAKMLFPKRFELKNDGIVYEAGKVYDIKETPGSVSRWLVRGCTIVEEEVKIDIKEPVKEEIKEEIKEVKPKQRRRKPKREE